VPHKLFHIIKSLVGLAHALFRTNLNYSGIAELANLLIAVSVILTEKTKVIV